MAKLKKGTKQYYKACAKYAYFLLIDILDKKTQDEHIAYNDILDCLYDIWAEEYQMLDTLNEISECWD